MYTIYNLKCIFTNLKKYQNEMQLVKIKMEPI